MRIVLWSRSMKRKENAEGYFSILMNGNPSYVDVCSFYRYMKLFSMNKIIIYLALPFLSLMYSSF